MTNDNPRLRPLDIVTACRSADLPILCLGAKALREFLPFRQLHVITARKNFSKFQRMLGATVELLDEDALIPGMTLAKLKELSLPGFPQGAGWYFQQLLKLSFGFHRPEDDYYLIWDADTIPLRRLEVFDDEGRMLFTTAEEHHEPYFETYRRLLQEEPNREWSFISQHMIVQKSIAREMLAKIESSFPEDDSWAWKIMRNLKGNGTNLFSEYEMLGHFVKNNYPSRAAYRRLPWLRTGSFVKSGKPSTVDLQRLGQQYYFAAFEASQMPLRKFVRRVHSWLHG
jgi:hypothetical protein